MPLKSSLNIPWVQTAALEKIPSPSLVLGLDAIRANLRKMLKIAGGPERLRPHVKTHKLPQLVQMQLELGINCFKCATIAEAEMCARAGAKDVLLAYQMVGPNIARYLALQRKYPGTKFSTVVDDAGAWKALAAAAERDGTKVEVLLEMDVGQHRTGVLPERAVEAYRALAKFSAFNLGGLHGYDGHISHLNPEERKTACLAAMEPVYKVHQQLLGEGLPAPKLVLGGSPTFPFQALRPEVECSPGTTVLWDASSALQQPDLPFIPAAIVLTRVVSKPATDLITLDLGHKAVASEMPHPRAIFPALPEAEAIKHSEEHLLLKSPLAAKFAVGDALLAIPWHVCPTVALHAEAVIVEHGRVTDTWPVEARARRITV